MPDWAIALGLLYWMGAAWYSWTWNKHLPKTQVPGWQQSILLVNSFVGWPFLWIAEAIMSSEFDREHGDPMAKAYGQGFDDAMRRVTDIPPDAQSIEMGPDESRLFGLAMADILGKEFAGYEPSGLHRECTVWLTGLSGAGKSTIAEALRARMEEYHHPCIVLDGDVMRKGLCEDLGYDVEARKENLRRAAYVAKYLNEAGITVIAAFITPLEESRGVIEEVIQKKNYVEVFVDTPLDICEERDPKGLYRRARAGEIKEFTGLDSPYEVPQMPDVHITTKGSTPEECAERVLDKIREMHLQDKEKAPE